MSIISLSWIDRKWLIKLYSKEIHQFLKISWCNSSDALMLKDESRFVVTRWSKYPILAGFKPGFFAYIAYGLPLELQPPATGTFSGKNSFNDKLFPVTWTTRRLITKLNKNNNLKVNCWSIAGHEQQKITNTLAEKKWTFRSGDQVPRQHCARYCTATGTWHLDRLGSMRGLLREAKWNNHGYLARLCRSPTIWLPLSLS